jgi:hypothetical protein
VLGSDQSPTLSFCMSSPADPKDPKPSKPTAPGSDVVLIHGPTDDQKGLKVLRARPEGLELGEVRPLEEGKPITGDVVKLEPRPGLPFVCDVKTELRLPNTAPQKADAGAGPVREAPSRPHHPGPAKVTTEAYRVNLDVIWKRPPSSGELN